MMELLRSYVIGYYNINLRGYYLFLLRKTSLEYMGRLYNI